MQCPLLLILGVTWFSMYAGMPGATACQQFPGFEFEANQESSGGDILGSPFNALDLGALAAKCRGNPTCNAFNTQGWLKHNLRPKTEWRTDFGAGDPCSGIYIKQSTGEPVQQVHDC
jgi:hypothetical protein